MLLASETSIQLTNALEKLIDSGIQIRRKSIRSTYYFYNRKVPRKLAEQTFCTYFGKKKSGPEYPVIPKEHGEYPTAHYADPCCDREIRYRTDRIRRTSRFCRCCHRYGTVW